MTTTFQLEPNEFNNDFLKTLKTLLKNRRATLTVETEMDETDRIMANPVMYKILQERIANVEKGEFVSFSNEEFNELHNRLRQESL